jgi:putative ABC transport system ATP-binding protein
MISVRNLAHRFAADTVLLLGAWRADRGERWLIAGPSGSGKTTLLSILAGLLRPTQGTVQIGEHEISAMSEAALDAWRGANVGYVPQRLHLVDSLNVRDNLLLAQYLAGNHVSSAAAGSLLRALGMDAFAERYPRGLSQGQAQLLGHALLATIGTWLPAASSLAEGARHPAAAEAVVVLIALSGGVLAALVPAWRAYRLEVAATLSKG